MDPRTGRAGSGSHTIFWKAEVVGGCGEVMSTASHSKADGSLADPTASSRGSFILTPLSCFILKNIKLTKQLKEQ